MIRCLLSLLLAGLMLFASGAHAALPALLGRTAAGSVVTTEHVRAELLAQAPDGVSPGGTVWLGLRIDHQPHWHTYWRNAGDSGLPTRLDWTLPAGVAAGDIQWPTPQKLPVQGGLVNYGYEGTVLLPVPVRIPADFQGNALAVSLKANWLVCQVECVPEHGDFSLSLPARSSTTMDPALFAATQAAEPRSVQGVSASAAIVPGPAPGRMSIRVQGLPPAVQGKPVHFFAETSEVLSNGEPVSARWDGDAWTAEMPLSTLREIAPAALPVVLTFGQASDAATRLTAGVRVVAPVSGTWPAAPARAELPEALREGLAADRAAVLAAPSGAPWLALALAFVGGLLLNLMPCVFPVLAIKALALARADSRPARLASGMAYGCGVMVTMLALAALLLVLRATGMGLGWGFQLQSPVFVALLACLFMTIGLHLSGVFEFSAVLPSSLGAWRGRRAWTDAFGAGALSVVSATPCTAPFMGAALGVALVQSSGWAMAIFVFLGAGLALPMVLLAAVPGGLRWLPRPGAWMDRLRTFLAFPMFATVIWLVWVIGQQLGINGAVGLLGVLLALAFLTWVVGLSRGRQTIGLGQWLARGAALAVVAGVLAWAYPALRSGPSGQGETFAGGDGWQRWSPALVTDLNTQGHPVFVDFTAAWCVTCQVNKRTTLEQPTVRAAFARRGVKLLRADWTRPDPVIARELARLGRNGLPVYLLLVPGQAPKLLPEILTPYEVERALATVPLKGGAT